VKAAASPWAFGEQLGGIQSVPDNLKARSFINVRDGLYAANTSGLLSPEVFINPSASDDAMADITREEFEARLDAASARTDAKFAEMMGEIRLISSDLKGELKAINTRLNGVEKSTGGVKATVVVVAIATLAAIVGILAFGQQWFGIGLTTRDLIRATVTEHQLQQSASAPAQVPTPVPAPTPAPPKTDHK
jgi:hypothetical protein